MFKRKSTQRPSHENTVKSHNIFRVGMHLFPRCTPICQLQVPEKLQTKLLTSGFLEEHSMHSFLQINTMAVLNQKCK